MFVMKNCFLLCVIGLTIACIICCRVNVTLDMILGVEDILISWFVIILVLLGVASLFVCFMIHCKHLRLSDANKLTYLLTYLLSSCPKCVFSSIKIILPLPPKLLLWLVIGYVASIARYFVQQWTDWMNHSCNYLPMSCSMSGTVWSLTGGNNTGVDRL